MALKHVQFSALLSDLVEIVPGKLASDEKKLLVRCVLDSYLNLRKLVLQRTNMVDDSQQIMLELLEDLTTGMFNKIKAC